MATSETVRADLARPAADTNQPAAQPSIIGDVQRMSPEFNRVLPAIMPPERFLRIALTVVRTSPALQDCSRESLLGALMSAAQLGLEPGGPLGHAYVIPYGKEATLVLGYKGLIDLAYRSGRLSSVCAETVYENDEFDFEFGLDPHIRHVPKITGGRGRSFAWYAAARIQGGGTAQVVMGKEDIERIRVRSKAKDSGPWRTDYDAMARKTAIKQLAKFLPVSAELAVATSMDGEVRTDTNPDALEQQAYTVEAETE